MPDDANSPSEPPRDSSGNPVPPPSFAPPPRPLPGNPPPPSFGSPPPGASGSPPPEQKYDLAGNPIPSPGGPPPGPPSGAQSYGAPQGAWPPPPAASYGQSPAPFGRSGVYPVAVNGTQILIMGIVSFFCFSIILGPVAYVQGSNALAAIDRGEADPAQRGNVAAGRICGLIAGIIGALGLVGYVILLLMGGLAGRH